MLWLIRKLTPLAFERALNKENPSIDFKVMARNVQQAGKFQNNRLGTLILAITLSPIVGFPNAKAHSKANNNSFRISFK